MRISPIVWHTATSCSTLHPHRAGRISTCESSTRFDGIFGGAIGPTCAQPCSPTSSSVACGSLLPRAPCPVPRAPCGEHVTANVAVHFGGRDLLIDGEGSTRRGDALLEVWIRISCQLCSNLGCCGSSGRQDARMDLEGKEPRRARDYVVISLPSSFR